MSFFTNFSYRLSRGQAVTLNVLAVGFIILSIVWFAFEMLEIKFPMEPIVVAFGGLATLFASYWPWKPSYGSKRMRGRVTINYLGNNKKYVIGSGDVRFTIEWSSGDASSIHVYNDPPDIDAIALAPLVKSFDNVRDCSVFDFSSRVVLPKEGEVVVLRNTKGNYALLQIHDVRAQSHGDDRDEVTFSYVINPYGGQDFSN